MPWKVCYVCRGRGEVEVKKEVILNSRRVEITEKHKCKKCNGTGRVTSNA